MWLNYPRVEGHGAKEEVCFAHRIFLYSFFFTFFLAHELLDDNFDVIALVQMWSFCFFQEILQGP